MVNTSLLCPFSGRRPEKWSTEEAGFTVQSQNSSATSQLWLQNAATAHEITRAMTDKDSSGPKPKKYKPGTIQPADEQAAFVGSMPENCNVKLDPLAKEAVFDIFSSSYSRQNFAWRLVRYLFEDSELKDHNCYGRKGKPALDLEKLCMVKDLVFAYYPLQDPSLVPQAWKACTIAIDKGIRNTFCDYHARLQMDIYDAVPDHVPFP